MRAFLTLLRRLTAVICRPGLNDDLREEIDAHIDLRRQALVDEGMDPRDAAFEARRIFGNVTTIHALVPARRVARLDPIAGLRAE